MRSRTEEFVVFERAAARRLPIYQGSCGFSSIPHMPRTSPSRRRSRETRLFTCKTCEFVVLAHGVCALQCVESWRARRFRVLWTLTTPQMPRIFPTGLRVSFCSFDNRGGLCPSALGVCPTVYGVAWLREGWRQFAASLSLMTTNLFRQEFAVDCGTAVKPCGTVAHQSTPDRFPPFLRQACGTYVPFSLGRGWEPSRQSCPFVIQFFPHINLLVNPSRCS